MAPRFALAIGPARHEVHPILPDSSILFFMPSRITLKDVALACGKDVSTVSLALRGHPRIPKTTREKIEAVARQLGYHPDPALSALIRHRQNGLGPKSEWSHLLYVIPRACAFEETPVSAIAGARRRAAELGYRIDLFRMDDYSSDEAAARILVNRGFVGLLLGRTLAVNSFPQWDWSPFCAVACGAGLAEPSIHMVTFDYFDAVRICAHKARAAGYRKIAFAPCRHLQTLRDDEVRIAACRYWSAEMPWTKNQPAPVYEGPVLDSKKFLPWMRRHQPDCLIAFNNAHYELLREFGWEVPARLGMAAIHYLPWSPQLSGTSLLSSILGAASVDFLNQLLLSNHRGLPASPYKLHLSPEWQEGSSLPNRNNAVGI